MVDILKELRELNGCEPGCEGRCRICPLDVKNAAVTEIERLRTALKNLAVVRCVGVARDGGEWPDGLLCQICDSESSEGEKLQHMLSCPLAA